MALNERVIRSSGETWAQSGVSLQAKRKKDVAEIANISTWTWRIACQKARAIAISGTLCVRRTSLALLGGWAMKKAEKKISKVMTEFKKGKLHSGSKKGPEVTNPKQAIAIALSEAGKAKKK